jgi:hypothetical protein
MSTVSIVVELASADLDADGFVRDVSDLSVLKHLTHPIQEKWLSLGAFSRPAAASI